MYIGDAVADMYEYEQGILRNTRRGPMVVGYMDLLGVSQRLVGAGIDIVLRAYEAIYLCLQGSKVYLGANGLNTTIRHAMFSDSLLMFADARKPIDVTLTVSMMAGLCEYLLRKDDIPMRGSIVVGDFCVNEEFDFYVGLPLLQAWAIESQLDAIGLVLLEPESSSTGLLAGVKELGWISEQGVRLKNDAGTVLRDRKVAPERLRMVRWTMIGEGPDSTQVCIGKLRALRDGAPERARRLYSNALEFLETEFASRPK